MNHVLTSTGALIVLGTGLSIRLPAQQNGTVSPGIEPAATTALNRMGAYLRTLRAFEITSEGTSELVLTDGLKIQRARKATIVATRDPDRLRAELEGDNGTKFYLFDGKTFTLFDRDNSFYATVAAPPTLGKLAAALDKYGIEIPLVDLFLWGRPESTPPEMTLAMDVGPSAVEGVTCEQYAFRQEGLDWQIWIQLGDFPLPRKMVLTTTTDEARPQHAVVFNWNLAPSYNDDAFKFFPPENARKIVFAAEPR